MARKRPLFLNRLRPLQVLKGSVARRWLPLLLLFGMGLGLVLIPLEPGHARPEPAGLSQPAAASLQQGIQLYRTEQYLEAIATFQTVQRSAPDPLTQAQALTYLSLAQQKLSQWQPAQAAIATSLTLLAPQRANPDARPMLAQALNTQGQLQLAIGQPQAALETWQQATQLYRQTQSATGQIGSLLNQAQALQVLGLYQQSLDTLADVTELLQAQPDLALKASGLRSLGNALRVVGDGQQSQQFLTQSLQLAETLGDQRAIADTLLSLGNTARMQSETKAALDYYRRAAEQLPQSPLQVQAQLNQLQLLMEGRQWSAATALLPALQTQIMQLPSNHTGIYSRLNFAQSLIRFRQLAIAQAAANSLEDNQDPIAGTRGQRAGSSAPATYLPAPTDEDLGVSIDLSALPTWQAIAQLVAVARQQAESLGDRRAMAYALGTLGRIYEQTRQWSTAQDLTQEALLLSQSIQAADIAYRWQWQSGRLLKAMGDEPGAIAAYSEAVKTLKSLRSDLVSVSPEVQFSFRDSVEPIYREFVGLLLQPTPEGQDQERIIRARNAIESLQLAELENFFRQACLQATPVQIDQVDQAAAVVYPVILPDRLEVILSLPNQPLRHYPIAVSQSQMEATLRQLRVSLTNVQTEEFLDISQQVHRWLIAPIQADLSRQEIKTLVFVLDGLMRNVPMAALHDGQQFLMQQYAIALTPGLQLVDVKPLVRERLKILAAGLSDARQGFTPLPSVEVEIGQIKSELPSQVLLNQDFTRQSLQQQLDQFAGPIIHLATHGEFSSKADRTFILTWDGKIDLNQLTSLLRKQAASRQSPIELLVLSACRTAIGDNRAALGLAGVAVRAGARSTIGTLWYVDDAATSSIMVQFYRELANTTISKAEAMRRAQLALLNDSKYNHPFYWAPYVLVGNWL